MFITNILSTLNLMLNLKSNLSPLVWEKARMSSFLKTGFPFFIPILLQHMYTCTRIVYMPFTLFILNSFVSHT